MDGPAALLREREVQGLRWFLFALIAAALTWGIGGAIFISSDTGKIFVFGSGLFAAAVDVGLLMVLARGRAMEAVGFATVAVAFATIAP